LSQYPQYYAPQPPPDANLSPEQLVGPARRAGTMMMIVGVLAVISGLCAAYWANNFDPTDPTAIPDPRMRQQMQQQINTFETQLGISFRTAMLFFAAVPLLLGAVTGGVGLYVRNGGLGPVIAGIVVVALMLIGVGFALLAGLIQGLAAGPAMLVASVCVYGVPFGLLVMLMLWLVQAARAAPRLAEARRRLEARQGQYEERQQAFRQEPGPSYPHQPPAQDPQQRPTSGLGYSYPPPPAPPPEQPGPPSAPPGKPGEHKDEGS
jgi:hypothetical protein